MLTACVYLSISIQLVTITKISQTLNDTSEPEEEGRPMGGSSGGRTVAAQPQPRLEWLDLNKLCSHPVPVDTVQHNSQRLLHA